MSPELWSILGLVVMFAVGTAFSVNLGAVSLVAAFLVGTSVAAVTTGDLLSYFPVDLFVLIAGTTYLLGIAQVNGTIEWLANAMISLVRGQHWMLPWLLFLVATALATLGPGAVPILASIGAGFIHRYRIHPVLIGLMIVHGAQAGCFSPIAPYGLLVNQILERNGVDPSPWALYGLVFLGNAILTVVGFLVFGGRRLMPASDKGQYQDNVDGHAGQETETRGSVAQQSDIGVGIDGDASPSPTPAAVVTATSDTSPDESRFLLPQPTQALTILFIASFLILISVFSLNVGFTAFLVAVILVLLSPRRVRVESIDRISWSTVLLVCGVLTYVGLLEAMGTVDYITNAISALGSPVIALLLACFVAALVSAMASSLGIIGVVVPLSLPLAAAIGVDPLFVVVAIGLCATVVDVSPFSTFGALVLANTSGVDKTVFQRKLLIYTGYLVVLAPLATWAALILPSAVG